VLWVRGADDRTVSDTSTADFGYLGKTGMVPHWPGEELYPPQPGVSQIRVKFLLLGHGSDAPDGKDLCFWVSAVDKDVVEGVAKAASLARPKERFVGVDPRKSGQRLAYRSAR
jgi:hypothetical protein